MLVSGKHRAQLDARSNKAQGRSVRASTDDCGLEHVTEVWKVIRALCNIANLRSRQDPVPDRDAHGIDTGAGQKGKIVLRYPRVPVVDDRGTQRVRQTLLRRSLRMPP